MKRTILFFISITFATTFVGQETDLIHDFFLKYDIDSYSIKKHSEKKSSKYKYYLNSKTKFKNFRPVTDAKQKLDYFISKMFIENTNEWISGSKHEYTYDSNGNVNIKIENSWDNTSYTWLPHTKIKYSFNRLNNPAEELRNYWNYNVEKWIPYLKYEYLYDYNDNIILKTRTDTNENTSQWVNKWKIDYLYNVNSRLISEQYSIWDTLTNLFIQSVKYEYTYDSIGNLTSEINNKWLLETGQWIIEGKFIYTYNKNNLDSTIVQFQRDYDANDSLIYRWKNEIYYDSNNYDKIEKYSSWKKDLSQWKPTSLFEHNYDSTGNHQLEILRKWGNISGNWYFSKKTEFVYDNNGNFLLYTDYLPDDNLGNWHINNKREYNYNYAFYMSEILFPELIDPNLPEYYENMINIPTNSMVYEIKNGIHIKKFEGTYHYSELNIGILEAPDKSIMIYPNPTTGQVMILNKEGNNFNEVNIYNQLGQKIYHKKIIDNKINLSVLEQGIYIIELVSDNSKIRDKIIIKE